jgi:hypothetical protein
LGNRHRDASPKLIENHQRRERHGDDEDRWRSIPPPIGLIEPWARAPPRADFIGNLGCSEPECV